jgi:hypothetical protein
MFIFGKEYIEIFEILQKQYLEDFMSGARLNGFPTRETKSSSTAIQTTINTKVK